MHCAMGYAIVNIFQTTLAARSRQSARARKHGSLRDSRDHLVQPTLPRKLHVPRTHRRRTSKGDIPGLADAPELHCFGDQTKGCYATQKILYLMTVAHDWMLQVAVARVREATMLRGPRGPRENGGPRATLLRFAPTAFEFNPWSDALQRI